MKPEQKEPEVTETNQPAPCSGLDGSPCSQLRPTPETTKAWHEALDWCRLRGEAHDPHHAALANLAEKLERERDAALDREAAILHFCEVEMSWEWFRAEFNIGNDPRKSLQNAKKLKEFLSANA